MLVIQFLWFLFFGKANGGAFSVLAMTQAGPYKGYRCSNISASVNNSVMSIGLGHAL